MTVAMQIRVDEHVERIDREGYSILEAAVEPALVAELRDTIRCLERARRPALGTDAEGHSTLRMYNLLAKRGPTFIAMPVHPSVLPVVERLLDKGCLLSGMTAMDIGPGEDAQPLHGDDAVMSRHLERPHR